MEGSLQAKTSSILVVARLSIVVVSMQYRLAQADERTQGHDTYTVFR